MNETATMTDASAEEVPEFEPLQLLAELEAQAQQPAPAVLRDKLPWKDIRQVPALFQPRGSTLNQQHVSDLVSAIGRGGKLDPVMVIQIGSQAVLIEGHHRLEAYRRTGDVDDIPVVYFTGAVRDAVTESGRANSRAKLTMPMQERQNYAWRLVNIGCYTKAQIVEAANISDGQVGIMRRVRKALGLEASGYPQWWQALQASKGNVDLTWNPDELESRKEALAQEYAERLSRAFYDKLAKNPEIAALALSKHFGDKIKDLYRELADHVGDEGDDDDDF